MSEKVTAHNLPIKHNSQNNPAMRDKSGKYWAIDLKCGVRMDGQRVHNII